MFLDLLALSHTTSWRREFGCLLCFPTDMTCVTSSYS